MSKSLIRKNQLHPDVADLISGYGNDYFITQNELNQALLGLEADLGLETIVYTTGNQIIFDQKTFSQRPIFNGSGLATTGELGGSTTFNGFRRITRSTIDGVTPGGTDVVTFLNNLFYPFVQATVTLNGYPLQELGTTVPFLPFEGSINPGSINISRISGFINNVLSTPELFSVFLNNNTQFDFDINDTNLTTTTTGIFVRINSVNSSNQPTTVTSNLQTLFFEAPIYAGSGSLNLMTLGPTNPGSNVRNILSGQGVTNPGTNNGKSLISKPASRTVSVTTNGYYYFVYPTGWGLLTSIQDTNFNLDFLSDFTSGTVVLPLANNTNHTYRWYRNNNQITLNNYGVRYIF